MIEETIIFKGIPVIKQNSINFCKYEDYIAARKAQGKKWSEKSFCDWCDKYNIQEIG